MQNQLSIVQAIGPDNNRGMLRWGENEERGCTGVNAQNQERVATADYRLHLSRSQELPLSLSIARQILWLAHRTMSWSPRHMTRWGAEKEVEQEEV